MSSNFYASNRSPWLVLALLLACAAGPASAQLFGKKEEVKPAVLNVADANIDAKAVLVSSGAASVPKRVVIASFTVEFVTEVSRYAKSGGLGGSVTQTTQFVLSGVDQSQLQAATDSAYDAFVAQAQAQGLEVVSKAELLATEAYKAALPLGKPSGLVKEQTGITLLAMAPTGMVVNGPGLAPLTEDYEAGANSAFGTLGAMAGVASTIGKVADVSSSIKPLEALPAALGGAQALSVRLLVYFVEMKAEFGSLASNYVQAGFDSKLGLYVHPGNSLVTLAKADNSGYRTLNFKQPLLIAGDAFQKVTDISPTGSNVAGAVFSALLGSKSSSRTTRYEVAVQPKRFADLAADGLSRTAPLIYSVLKTQ
jgi:hypothetical protein